MRISDIDFRDILLEEESYKITKNILYKSFMGEKSLKHILRKKYLDINYNLSDFSYSY